MGLLGLESPVDSDPLIPAERRGEERQGGRGGDGQIQGFRLLRDQY